MFDKLLSTLLGQADASAEDKSHAADVALAALLVEAARADGVYIDAERTMIDAILAERFGLDAAGAEALRREAERAADGAADLVQFTRAVKEAVPFDARVEVIEAIWRVAYADADRCGDEAALVRKLAGLLYVPDREVGLARQRVAKHLG